MVGKNLWQTLKELSTFDESILEFQRTIETLKEQKNEQSYAVEDLEEELYEHEKLVLSEKKNVALQELYAKELVVKQEAVREKIKQVKHKNELDALEREFADIQRKQEIHDNVLVRAWQNRDNVLKQIDVRKKALEVHAQEAAKAAAVVDQKIQELQSHLDTLTEKRMQIVALLDVEWAKRYERVKNIAKDPIVKLVQNSCGSCFYLVASKDLVELKSKHIIVCRNCYRFIYQDDQVAEQQQATL